MAGVNRVTLIGRTGKDTEAKHFDNGGIVANTTLATSEVYKDKQTGEKKEITDWHNLSCRIPALASVFEKYVKKGDMIYVEGKLRTRSWEKDGKTNYITEVLVDNLQMLGSKQPHRSDGPTDDAPQGKDDFSSSEDLPF
jgi:single-strand DNA-binding protein